MQKTSFNLNSKVYIGYLTNILYNLENIVFSDMHYTLTIK